VGEKKWILRMGSYGGRWVGRTGSASLIFLRYSLIFSDTLKCHMEVIDFLFKEKELYPPAKRMLLRFTIR
jgi:hypothetical protein